MNCDSAKFYTMKILQVASLDRPPSKRLLVLLLSWTFIFLNYFQHVFDKDICINTCGNGEDLQLERIVSEKKEVLEDGESSLL